ncbi:hypothetical protein BDF20DRAFT_80276 [Mycotypha africana]|uniref:uncharacterized protein n=1 Tax=Mycotypha africana TaxID=64632 RepID=UPI0022FFF0BE|nr:uncharacterized protein BDF20DRAFT_80276 [Mycotypha africana]KAI8991989.1 hypothetical protein BDF20DRAFT_80276 [Mycotypha africana]
MVTKLTNYVGCYRSSNTSAQQQQNWQQYTQYGAPGAALTPQQQQDYAAYYQQYPAQTADQQAYYQQYYQSPYSNPPPPGVEGPPGVDMHTAPNNNYDYSQYSGYYSQPTNSVATTTPYAQQLQYNYNYPYNNIDRASWNSQPISTTAQQHSHYTAPAVRPSPPAQQQQQQKQPQQQFSQQKSYNAPLSQFVRGQQQPLTAIQKTDTTPPTTVSSFSVASISRL